MRIRDVRGFHANRDERDSITPPDPSPSLSHQLSELHATRDLLAIFVPLHYAKFLHQGGAYGEESIRRWQKYNTRYGIIREEVGKHVVRSSDGVAAVSASTYVCRRYCLFRGL